jgi:hypothetical protein
MVPKSKPTVEERAVLSAERALASQKFVSAVDVLVNMGFVAATHAENWRKGRIDYFEQFIQASPNKVDRALTTFHRWAKERGLTPSEARYVVQGRAGTRELRFTATGDPEAERIYRTPNTSRPICPRARRRKSKSLPARPPSGWCSPSSVIRVVRNAARNCPRTASCTWKTTSLCAWRARGSAIWSTCQAATPL